MIDVPYEVKQKAESIIDENHDILNPKVYLKHKGDNQEFINNIKSYISTDSDIDYVLFSSRSGATEHTDIHLKHLDTNTYIIPIILPNAHILLTHSEGESNLKLYTPVKINHQLPHRLDVTTDEPCVLVMASEIL